MARKYLLTTLFNNHNNNHESLWRIQLDVIWMDLNAKVPYLRYFFRSEYASYLNTASTVLLGWLVVSTITHVRYLHFISFSSKIYAFAWRARVAFSRTKKERKKKKQEKKPPVTPIFSKENCLSAVTLVLRAFDGQHHRHYSSMSYHHKMVIRATRNRF